MPLWNGFFTSLVVLAAAWSCLCSSPVDAVTLSVPFGSSAELLQAVDTYLSADPDEQAVLEIISQFGVMESWDVSKITDFSHIFSRDRNPNAVQLHADLSQWDVSNSQSFANMFQGARIVDFDVSTWDVSNAKNFSRMFDSASSFQGRGLASWDISSGQDFTEMFRGATSFGTNDNNNNLCVWRDLLSKEAVTENMFLESQCPTEQDERDDLDAVPSLRAADGADSVTVSFCQPCPLMSETQVPESDSTVYNEGEEGEAETTTTTSEETDNKKRPNILLLMTDQQRFDTIRYVQDELQQYNDVFKIDTPNLDRLVQEGAYFRNAYCQCAVCAPARTTIRTGCTIERTGVQHNDLAEEYLDGELFKERVESLESLDHILVEKYGYISEYYGKWHMPELLYLSKSNPSESIVQFNDFDFVKDQFEFKGDDSSRKIRRYLEQYEEIGLIDPERKSVNSTAVVTGRLAQLTRGNPQIDSYTRYPYIPIQLDNRYNSPPGTDLKDGTFDSNERSQSNLMGIYSLTEEEGTPTHFTGDIAIRALHRLKAQPEPWFLTVSFHHPHPPFIAPFGKNLAKYWDNREFLYVPESLNDPMDNTAYSVITDEFPGYKDPSKIQEWTALYYALIEEVDAKIGEIFEALADASDDTLIIFTSDHGEMLGAHKQRSKNNFYEESSRIPLIMKFPGQIDAGMEVNETVSHIDLFATILDYAGASKDDNSDGKSLRAFIEGTEYNQDYDEGDVVFAEWDFRKPTSSGSSELDREMDERPSFLVRKGAYKLMMQKLASSKEMDMMFNLKNDPFEMDNLLGKNAMKADTSTVHKAEHMRCLLLDWMERLDGEKGYFSDPAANYGEGKGDIKEIRNRQQWKEVGFWISDDVLEFGKLTKWEDGAFVRHEHLYFGTRKNETITVTSINISGPDAESFVVDQTSLDFGYRDCRSIRVSLMSRHDFPHGSKLNATVTLEIQTSSSTGSFYGQPTKSSYNVQLSLSTDVYGVPGQAEEAQSGQDGEGGAAVDAEGGSSTSVGSPSQDGATDSDSRDDVSSGGYSLVYWIWPFTVLMQAALAKHS